MRTAGNKDELDHEDYENITDEFKEMMRTKLTWHYLKAMDIWVFWIDDKDDGDGDDDSKESFSLRTRYAGSSMSDPAPKTVPMANWRINWKLHSIIRSDPMVSEDNANEKTVPNENEETEVSVGDDAVDQHSGKKLDSVAESFGVGDDSWRKYRSGDDWMENRSQRRARAEKK